MKIFRLTVLTLVFSACAQISFGQGLDLDNNLRADAKSDVEQSSTAETDTGATSAMSKKEMRQKLKDLRKEFKAARKKGIKDVGMLILVILAILLPPIAVYLVDGTSGRFWFNLVLWLVGLGLGAALLGPTLIWLGGLLAIIHALIVVLE